MQLVLEDIYYTKGVEHKWPRLSPHLPAISYRWRGVLVKGCKSRCKENHSRHQLTHNPQQNHFEVLKLVKSFKLAWTKQWPVHADVVLVWLYRFYPSNTPLLLYDVEHAPGYKNDQKKSIYRKHAPTKDLSWVRSAAVAYETRVYFVYSTVSHLEFNI